MWRCPECGMPNKGSVCKKCGYAAGEWEETDGDWDDDSTSESEKRAIIAFVCVLLAVVLAIGGVTAYRHARMNRDYAKGNYVNYSIGIEIRLPKGKWDVSETEDYLVSITPKGMQEDGSSIEIYKTEESAFDMACFEEEIEEMDFKGHECYKAVDGTDEAFSVNYYISAQNGTVCVSIAGGEGKKITMTGAQQLINYIEII